MSGLRSVEWPKSGLHTAECPKAGSRSVERPKSSLCSAECSNINIIYIIHHRTLIHPTHRANGGFFKHLPVVNGHMVTIGQPFPVPGGTLSDHITCFVAAFEPLHLATYIGHIFSLAASSPTVIGRLRAFSHWPHSSLTFTGRTRALHSVSACEPYISSKPIHMILGGHF